MFSFSVTVVVSEYILTLDWTEKQIALQKLLDCEMASMNTPSQVAMSWERALAQAKMVMPSFSNKIFTHPMKRLDNAPEMQNKKNMKT